MVQGVITLPLRIGADAARLGLRVVGQTVAFGVSAAERLIGVAMPPPTQSARPAHGDSPPADVAAAPSLPVDEMPTPPPAAEIAPEPAHVSREAELVESFADPGAEDGAGASVRIDEPWKGYGRMTASEVTARLAVASAEELAAVVLYERAHQDRRTVVAAAERRLRRAAATPSPAPR
jgi:hypothetical protein